MSPDDAVTGTGRGHSPKTTNAGRWYDACVPVLEGVDEGQREELFARLQLVAESARPGVTARLDDDGLACALQAWLAQADPTPVKVAAAGVLAGLLHAGAGLSGSEPASARITYDVDPDPVPRGILQHSDDLAQRFRERWACGSEWGDRGQRICGRHGYWWPRGQAHCNDERGQLAAEALRVLEQAEPQ